MLSCAFRKLFQTCAWGGCSGVTTNITIQYQWRPCQLVFLLCQHLHSWPWPWNLSLWQCLYTVMREHKACRDSWSDWVKMFMSGSLWGELCITQTVNPGSWERCSARSSPFSPSWPYTPEEVLLLLCLVDSLWCNLLLYWALFLCCGLSGFC